MKKISLIFSVLLIISCLKLSGQITQSCNGWVGIGPFWGSNPRYLFDVNGHAYFSCIPATSGFYFTNYRDQPVIMPQWNNALILGDFGRQLYRVFTQTLYVNGVMVTSDIKLKENIRPLGNSLSNIMRLNPVKFDYKAEIYNDSLSANKEELLLKRKDYSGFIAQEVKQTFPKLVENNIEADVLHINYLGFIPELVNAIKEQQIIIESLQSEIQKLKKESGSNKLKSATTISNAALQGNLANALFQNTPNPFSQTTTIEYSLVESFQKAIICIYDMNGTQLKCVQLNNTGYGSITINGNEYKAGMYMYSLIVDGLLIDTKRMVLID